MIFFFLKPNGFGLKESFSSVILGIGVLSAFGRYWSGIALIGQSGGVASSAVSGPVQSQCHLLLDKKGVFFFFSDATTMLVQGRATGSQVRLAIVRIGGTRVN